ncbi:MAG: DUF4147 domain-containing protein [Planctomycetaceae bacterium]|jgi:glycerate-2-kinase|nr:DUF4147 domain-containing protein [Planctomycetaceae bacterium]
MSRTPIQIREDLISIWQAGVNAVLPDRLVSDNVFLLLPDDPRNVDDSDYSFEIGGEQYPLSGIDRVVVVGGGKASGGMAAGFLRICEPILGRVEVTGWVNVPSDCVVPLEKIHLHAARQTGKNEPTNDAVFGTEKIIELLESLTKFDLCICLISGGGSALLPAPAADISLEAKCELTRFLSDAGATIQELNTVRKTISRIKGGGLKRICQGKRLISLILSDVLGDPPDVIASGPTVDSKTNATDALNVLRKFINKPTQNDSLNKIFKYIENKSKNETQYAPPKSAQAEKSKTPVQFADEIGNKTYENETGFVKNIVVGNNAIAVEAAGMEALRRGYNHTLFAANTSEGFAEDVGARLVQLGLDMQNTATDCLIHGGEPVVKLVPKEIRGDGGRNQQLLLAAICKMLNIVKNTDSQNSKIPIAILAGSTDGEDGPTDAAGAWIDQIAWDILVEEMQNNPNYDPNEFLKRNDAYNFFKPLNTLIKTGITGTNVCDLRIVLDCR